MRCLIKTFRVDQKGKNNVFYCFILFLWRAKSQTDKIQIEFIEYIYNVKSEPQINQYQNINRNYERDNLELSYSAN